MKKRLLFRGVVCLAVLALLLGPTKTARAALVTFDFAGTVTSVDPLLSGTFNTTQTISGSYTFDPTTPNSLASSTLGIYVGALSSLTFTIREGATDVYTGGLPIPGAGNSILVENDREMLVGVFNDSYAVAALISGADVAGIPVHNLVLLLRDPTFAAFDNVDLPTSPPDLSKFSDRGWSLQFAESPGEPPMPSVEGQLASLTSPIPEPGTLLLLGSGVVGMGAAARRRSRRK